MKHGILLLAAAMLAAATGAAEAAKEGDATPCKFSCPSGTSSVPRRLNTGPDGKKKKAHLGEHGSVFCSDVDEPWYGECCMVLSTCYHVCNFEKTVCDSVFQKCAKLHCDALEEPGKCNEYLSALMDHIAGPHGCEVFTDAQNEGCTCMHDEL